MRTVKGNGTHINQVPQYERQGGLALIKHPDAGGKRTHVNQAFDLKSPKSGH